MSDDLRTANWWTRSWENSCALKRISEKLAAEKDVDAPCTCGGPTVPPCSRHYAERPREDAS